MLQDATVAIAESHVAAVDNLAAQAGAAEVYLQLFGLPDGCRLVLQVVEGVLAVAGLAGAGARGTAHPFQFPPVNVAVFLVQGAGHRQAFFPFLQIILIITLVCVQGAAVQLQDGVAHPVQEVAVVGHHKQRPAALGEVILQIFDSVEVQVVGGLVQYHEIGVGGQHGGYRHPLGFAAGETGTRAVEVAQAQRREYLLDLGLQLPAVAMHRTGGNPADDLLQDGLAGVQHRLLLQECYHDVLQELDFAAAVAGILACQNAQQRGLARAVGSYERNLVSFVDIERNMLEKHLRAIRFGDVFYLQIAGHGAKIQKNAKFAPNTFIFKLIKQCQSIT